MKYLTIFKKHFKWEISKVYIEVIEAITLSFFLLLQFLIWKNLVRNVKYFLWYYSFSFLISRIVKMDSSLLYTVISGEIESYLVKPINLIIFDFLGSLVRSFLSFLFSLFPIISITYLLVGKISIANVFIVVLSLPFAALINYSFQLLISSYSFKSYKAEIIQVLFGLLNSLLSGRILPLNFFPFLKYIWVFSPFSYVTYFQAKLLLNSIENAYFLLIIEILMSVILVIISVKVWNKKVEEYMRGTE